MGNRLCRVPPFPLCANMYFSLSSPWRAESRSRSASLARCRPLPVEAGALPLLRLGRTPAAWSAWPAPVVDAKGRNPAERMDEDRCPPLPPAAACSGRGPRNNPPAGPSGGPASDLSHAGPSDGPRPRPNAFRRATAAPADGAAPLQRRAMTRNSLNHVELRHPAAVRVLDLQL